MRKIFIILFCSVVVLLAGYAGYRGYKVWKCNHLMSLAHQFAAKKDVRNTLLCVQQVLQTDPHNLDATRMMAELSTGVRALVYWSRVVELDPHSLDDRLALAITAIGTDHYDMATNALAGVNQADRNTVGYQNVAGQVALRARQFARAEAHFLKASQIDPQNQSVQLNLAIIRLAETNDLDQAEARIALERISRDATNVFLRGQALGQLTLDALRHQQTDKALSLSKQLAQETNAPFQTRLLRLDVLRQGKNVAFNPTLAAFQHEAADNPAKIRELAMWQMTRLAPQETLMWLRTLPQTTRTNQAVELLLAENYARVRNWHGLQSAIEKQNWAESEFYRHAFLSLALRKQQMADSAKAEWELALQTAGGNESRLSMLLRFAAQWGWQNESEQILWMIVNRYPSNLGAVMGLSRLLALEGRTQSLLQLYRQEARLFPSNAGMKNNLAMTAMLLDKPEDKPYELAREVYQSSPTNASYVSTYAFSLYKQGKNAEALKVMNTLKPAELRSPSIIGYYGLILKAAGDRAEAKACLERAGKGHLLPEEAKMFDQAKAGL